MNRVRPTMTPSTKLWRPRPAQKGEYLDALIESFQSWLSSNRSRSDDFEGQYEVVEEIARLRKLQAEREAA